MSNTYHKFFPYDQPREAQDKAIQFALDSLKKHNLFKALYLISKRILKCHPFGSSGYDPVPD